MNDDRNAYARLVAAIDTVRKAFVRGSVADAAYALDDARHWALVVGNPWAAELGDMAAELGPAACAFRDVEDRFGALFPEGDPDD
jgi:hypothetical protein